MNKLLHRTATAFALAGVLTALAVAVMVVVSIAGRSLASYPIPGDVEITQFGVALCISLCLPWSQLQRANIIVDFFTQRLPERRVRLLDGIGAVLLALMCALLAWRTGVGAVAVHQARETSMILALPMWWAYASLAPGLALAALIAVVQGTRLMRGLPP